MNVSQTETHRINTLRQDQKENASTMRCLNVFRRHQPYNHEEYINEKLEVSVRCKRCEKTKFILASGGVLWAFPEDVELLSEEQLPATESEIPTIVDRVLAIGEGSALDKSLTSI